MAQLARLAGEAAARRLEPAQDVAQAVEYAWPRAHGILWDLQVDIKHARWLLSNYHAALADAKLEKTAKRIEAEVAALSERELMR